MGLIATLILILKALGLMICIAIAAGVLIVLILCIVNVVKEINKRDKK